jgi:colanic acid biosynthesis glycosyl transferase WcaI
LKCLRNDALHRGIISQKTQAYLAAGRLIIMGVKGYAADLIEGTGAGVLCDLENPASIATAVKKLYDMSAEEREALGRNGLAFYEQYLSFTVGVEKMASISTGFAL